MSSLENVSALERRFNATVPQQAILSDVAARLKKIGASANIPGFRPGKVPVKILAQHYGAQAHKEALSNMVQNSFAEAVQLNNLRIVGHPRFEIKSGTLNSDAIEYSAFFEVYPEVVMDDLSGETMERLTCELTQADVDSAIMKLRKQRATYEPVDRAAQNEDQVHINLEGKHNGEAFTGGEAIDGKFVLGAGKLLPVFEAAITGMKAGETKSFDMALPDDYQDSDMAGKQVTFTIVLHEVEAPKLPEVDAAFAESVGIKNGDSGSLESEVRSNLQREMMQRIKAHNKKTAMDALLKAARFEAPKTLVDQEAKNLMQQAAKELESHGLKNNDAGLSSGTFQERAEKRVKLGLIITHLAQQHGLQAKPEQARALVDDYAQNFENPDDMVNWYYANPPQMKEVENLALEDNIAGWVMEQAKATEKAVPFGELLGN